MSEPGLHPWWYVTYQGKGHPKIVTVESGQARGARALEIGKETGVVADVAPIPSPFCYQPEKCCGQMQCLARRSCTS